MSWLWGVSAVSLLLACSSEQAPNTSHLGSEGSQTASGGHGASSGAGPLPDAGADGSVSAGGNLQGGMGSGGMGSGGMDSGGMGSGGMGSGGMSMGGSHGTGTVGGAVGGGAGSGAGVGGGEGSPLSLGMNDVTILAPLPESITKPVLLLGADAAEDGTPFVPRPLLERLDDAAPGSILSPDTYERLHLVAVRFDLCDHHAAGPCPTSTDASLRLVFQPLSDSFGAEDVGLHAFYSIAESEIPAAIQALTELSELRSGPAEPLLVSVPLSEGNTEYTEKLRGFVRRYSGERRLVRLTMNAQPVIFASITWLFRGLEKQGTEFEDMLIHGTAETTQQVSLVGEGFFQVSPVSDAPQGLALALDLLRFGEASASDKRAALAALVAIDNPLTSAPDTVACVGCHTSSVALAMRSADMGLDAHTLPGNFTTSFDVSIAAGESATFDRTLRALGWVRTTPLISQRVAHDTALVLEDLARWRR